MSAQYRPFVARLGAGAVLLAIAGCGILDDDGSEPRAGSPEEINTGLSRLGNSGRASPTLTPIESKKTGASNDPAMNLSEVFDAAASKKAGRPAPAPAATDSPAAAPVVPAAKTEPGLPQATSEQRIATLGADLRKAVEEGGHRPFADAVFLTALDLVAPAPARAEGAHDPAQDLSPPQRRVLAALRELLAAVATGSASDGDPTKAAGLLEKARHDLAAGQSVRIGKVVLCRRVMGFGQYEPFGTTTFVAGRTNRIVVYVEIENFSHRSAREGDPGRDAQAGLAEDPPLWTVELGQEIWMTHDADGTTQWRRPEQTITEVSRNRRRDFYLVQQIDLPATLSVGRFNLKVILRDKTNGSTDEHVVPVTIVADEQTALRAPAPVKPKPRVSADGH